MIQGRLKMFKGIDDRLIANETSVTGVPYGKGKGDYYYTWLTTSIVPSRTGYILSYNPYINALDVGIVRPQNGVNDLNAYRLVKINNDDGSYSNIIYRENINLQGQYNSIIPYWDFGKSTDADFREVSNFYSFGPYIYAMSPIDGILIAKTDSANAAREVASIPSITDISSIIWADFEVSNPVLELFIATASGINAYTINSTNDLITSIGSTTLINKNNILLMSYLSTALLLMFITESNISTLSFNLSSGFGSSLVVVNAATPLACTIGVYDTYAFLLFQTLTYRKYSVDTGTWNTLISYSFPDNYSLQGLRIGAENTGANANIRVLVNYINTNTSGLELNLIVSIFSNTGLYIESNFSANALPANAQYWHLPNYTVGREDANGAYPLVLNNNSKFPTSPPYIIGTYIGLNTETTQSITPPPLNRTDYLNKTLHVITSMNPLRTKLVRI